MDKKGQTWVSAVLYVAIGTVILTIILAAGIPVINKIRDRNTIIQTKNAMHEFDSMIRTMINEGPGSQRMRTIDFKSGELEVNEAKEEIVWKMETEHLESEPGITIKEGTLGVLTEEDQYVVGKYWIKLSLNYLNFADIDLVAPTSSILKGRHNLLIRNEGLVNNKIRISIEEK